MLKPRLSGPIRRNVFGVLEVLGRGGKMCISSAGVVGEASVVDGVTYVAPEKEEEPRDDTLENVDTDSPL